MDPVRNPRELFAVVRPPDPGSRARIPFTRREYEALHRDSDVFADSAGMLRLTTRVHSRPALGTLVTGNFFHMLGVTAAPGRALTPADDQPQGGQPVAASLFVILTACALAAALPARRAARIDPMRTLRQD